MGSFIECLCFFFLMHRPCAHSTCLLTKKKWKGRGRACKVVHMLLFISLLSSHNLIIKNLVWHRRYPHSPSRPWGDCMGCQMEAAEDKTCWNSEAPESIHRLPNAGLTRCSHGNMRMSRALSTFREAQWGTACKLCDAHSTSAYACTVWQAGRAYLWIITTDIDHIKRSILHGALWALRQFILVRYY